MEARHLKRTDLSDPAMSPEMFKLVCHYFYQRFGRTPCDIPEDLIEIVKDIIKAQSAYIETLLRRIRDKSAMISDYNKRVQEYESKYIKLLKKEDKVSI